MIETVRGAEPAILCDRSRSVDDKGAVTLSPTSSWSWETVGKTRVCWSRASSPVRRTATSVLRSWTEARRMQKSGIIVTSPREILSMSASLIMGNKVLGRSGVCPLVRVTRSMKALTISSLVGGAIL